MKNIVLAISLIDCRKVALNILIKLQCRVLYRGSRRGDEAIFMMMPQYPSLECEQCVGHMLEQARVGVR